MKTITRTILALALLCGAANAQTLTGPVLDIGNSDARENGLNWPQDFGITPVIYSFYSNTCEDINLLLPYLIRMYQAKYPGQNPAAIVNWENQCDMEKRNSAAAVLECDLAIMQREADNFPGVTQIWPNVAPEPQYSLGPPSNYSPMIWALNVVYNQVSEVGVNGIPGLPSYAQSIGVPYLSVDAYNILRQGFWANPQWFTYPSVDPNDAGEHWLDLAPQGIGWALQQAGAR